MKLTRVTVPDLKVGDVVFEFGMRIKLDREIPTHREGVKALAGIVLNADELCDKTLDTYDPYIARHLRGIWFEDRGPGVRKDEWTVQGNHLAVTWRENAE